MAKVTPMEENDGEKGRHGSTPAEAEEQRTMTTLIDRLKGMLKLQGPNSPSRPGSEQDADENASEEEKEYNVFDYYKQDSWSGKLAMHKHFEHVTLGVISLNAFWIGFDTDHNDSSDITTAQLHFVVAENMFCFYFTFEVIVRFLAFDRKISCLWDHWFKFDWILVSFMILETWVIPLMLTGDSSQKRPNLSILRLLRLFRLTRMARLMRSVPELLTLIKGMVAATRSVFSTLVLLIVLMYVFGIVFTSTYSDVEEFQDLFGCMGLSMLVLFVNGTLLDDLTNVMGRILERDQTMVWVFIVYILAASFTVLNMLIGVLCEIVSATAQSEQDELTVKDVKAKLETVFREIDADGSGMISEFEFERMKGSRHCMEAMEQLGVEPKHLMAMSDTIFEADEEDLSSTTSDPGGFEGSLTHGENSGMARRRSMSTNNLGAKSKPLGRELSFEEFLEFVVHLRPGTTASVLDIADLRKALRRLSRKMEVKFDDMEQALGEINQMAASQASVGGGGRSEGNRRSSGQSLGQLPLAPADNPSVDPKSNGRAGHARQMMLPQGGGSKYSEQARVRLTEVSTIDILNELGARP